MYVPVNHTRVAENALSSLPVLQELMENYLFSPQISEKFDWLKN